MYEAPSVEVVEMELQGNCLQDIASQEPPGGDI